MENYMPKVDPKYLCSALQLCSVRKTEGEYQVAVKRLDGSVTEMPLVDVANAEIFEELPIVRTYGSGHVFFSDDKQNIYLVTTEKRGSQQVQFTGGSPLEVPNQDVVQTLNGEITFHLGKIEENALIRTKNRVGVDVLENRHELPLVDWVLMENKDENDMRYWKLVCLFHYIVKSYASVLTPQGGIEGLVEGQWYTVLDVIDRKIENLAPNADIIVKKALEIIGE